MTPPGPARRALYHYLKAGTQQALDPLVMRVLIGIHPNILTGLGVLSAVAAGASLWRGWYLAAPPCILIRMLLNVADGQVARRAGNASRTGAVWNEFSDRLADIGLFGGAALAAPVGLAVGLATLVAVELVSYMGILPQTLGLARQYGGISAKIPRQIVLTFAATGQGIWGEPWLRGGLIVIALGALVTVGQRLWGAFREARA
jgi:CDP-diacylglycerol--glycerol-3-phosphate 3-phosphatidyltransferase